MVSQNRQYFRGVIFFAAMLLLCATKAVAGGYTHIPYPGDDFVMQNTKEICASFNPYPITNPNGKWLSEACNQSINGCAAGMSSRLKNLLGTSCSTNPITKDWICDTDSVNDSIKWTKSDAENIYKNQIVTACSPSPAPTAPVTPPFLSDFDSSQQSSVVTVEVFDLDTSSTTNSVKDKGREICESFVQAKAVKTKACEEAIEACVTRNDKFLRDVLDDTKASSSCRYHKSYPIAAHWVCSVVRWSAIENYMKEGTDPAHKKLITKECEPEELTASNVAKAPGVAPADLTPPDSSKGFSGDLSPAAPSPSTSPSPLFGKNLGVSDTGCSMNPLALGNVSTGMLSYLPFFVLMFVFGFTKKRSIHKK